MKIPVDIDKLYLPVWEEFCKMKAVRELKAVSSEAVVSECFRLLITAAGTNVRMKMRTQDHVSFAQGIKDASNWWKKSDLKKTLKLRSLQSKVFYRENGLIHAAIQTHLQVEALFQSRLSKMSSYADYDPIEESLRVADGRVWRLRPVKLTREDYMGRKRTYLKQAALKAKDFYCVYDTETLTMGMSRAREGIVVRLTIQGPKAAPLYKNYDSAVRTIKNNQLRGVF